MKSSHQAIKQALLLFVIAAATTFCFITVLQFLSPPWFFIALVLMHVGIVLFIVSRQRFKKLDLDVSRYFFLQYALLIPYLLMMFYTFAARADLLPTLGTEKLVAVLLYTMIAAVVTFWNYARMKRALDQHLN